MLQAGRSPVRLSIKSLIFSVHLILKPHHGSGVHSAPNRNEYQKQKNNVSVIKVRQVLRTDNLTAIYEPIV
jgi:hypothetical protein